MGSTVEQIGVRAFYNCLSLYKVKLSSNLKVIKYGAFENCRSLKGAIRLPITIEKIETWAFKNHDNTSGLWFILSKKILEIPNKKLLLPSWPESEKLWWGKKNRFVISDN